MNYMKLTKKEEDELQIVKNVMVQTIDVSLIESSETFRKVREHRRTCEKWKNREACIHCMGGGLVRFAYEVIQELTRKYRLTGD